MRVKNVIVNFRLWQVSEGHGTSALDGVLVAAIVFVCTENLVLPVHSSTTVFDPLAIALLVICFILMARARLILTERRSHLIGPLLALSFVPGIFIAHAHGASTAYSNSKVIAIGVALVLITGPAALRSWEHAVRIGIFALLVLAIATAVAVLIWGRPTSSGRISILEMNPIGIARVASLAIPICVTLLLSSTRRTGLQTTVLGSGIAAGVLGTVATGSRGPLVSSLLGCVAVVAVMIYVGRFRVTRRVVIAVLSLAGVGIVVLQHTVSYDRILSMDGSGRGELLSATWRAIEENPLGVGWGMLPQYIDWSGGADGGILYPHNVFLEIWSEGGPVALAGFCLTIFICALRSVRTAIETNSPVAYLVLALLVVAVSNAQFSSDLVGNRLMWGAIGLAACSPAILSGNRGAQYPQPQLLCGEVDCE